MLIASFNEFSTYYGAKSNSGLLAESSPSGTEWMMKPRLPGDIHARSGSGNFSRFKTIETGHQQTLGYTL